MGYLYRLEDNTFINRFTDKIGYISVKKPYKPTEYNSLAIYLKNKHGEGVFGIGEFLTLDFFKLKNIINEENAEIQNKNYLQFKINLEHTFEFPIVNLKYLKLFPTYNAKFCYKPKHSFRLYWDAGICRNIFYLINECNYDYKLDYCNDAKWKYNLHCLRDGVYTNQWTHMKEKNICKLCGINKNHTHFFELHDTVKIDLFKDFVPLNRNNYIVVCQECHINIHKKMENRLKL